MANCPHSSFKQGKRIIIIFNDGTQAVDKFLGKKRGCIITQRLGRISLRKIRSTGVYRNKTT